MKLTRIEQILMVGTLVVGAMITNAPGQAKLVEFASEITVIQEKHNGWEVTANGVVSIKSPTGNETVLSEPFKTAHTNWTPTEAIRCEWSPDGIVAIFAQHPRVTDIFVFNTKTGKALKEVFTKKKMPAWYDNVAIVHDYPNGTWNNGKLVISSKVTLRNGEKHSMDQNLQITGQTFTH